VLLSRKRALIISLAFWAGCAEVSRTNEHDLGMPLDLNAGVDAAEDFAAEQPDLTIACDMGAGFRICATASIGKCIAPDQCCSSNECPTPQNGGPLCNTLNKCDVACNSGYKACNGSCIPSAECCSDGDCTTPGDNCKLVQGAKCTAGVCSYPPVECPYSGQFCDPGTGNCVCPGNQHPCVTQVAGKPQGQCIPDGTCCTGNDCTATSGQVCPGPGGTCTCTAGFKACSASHSCILTTQCCDDSDCTVAGQHCSGAGGSCNCPSMQKACGANCIPISNCCIDAECSVNVSGSKCNGGTCGCSSGSYECDTAGSKSCITNGTCCPTVSCPHTNEQCSGVGGMCQCPSNYFLCNSTICIPNGHCCINNCSVSGQTCVGAPDGSCQCPGGQRACSTDNKCISAASGSCCQATISSDCPTGGSSSTHVASASCSSNLCGVTGCQSGWVDVNRSWSDGCECADSPWGKNCNARSSQGPFDIGQGTSLSGNLPQSGEENWFAITFTGDTCSTSYHPHITLQSSDNIYFDVRTSGACNPPALSCQLEGGSASVLRQWEVQSTFDGNTFGLSCTQAVGGSGTVFVRVFRYSGPVSCNSYTLNITNY
jgi:hypothetical protein